MVADKNRVMKYIEFNSSIKPTIGVEIELQLIDNATFDLKNISHKILADIDKKFSNRIKYELFESTVEINTAICNTVQEVDDDIKRTLSHLESILTNYDASINFSSLHPFARGEDQIITDDSRYKRIMKDLQIIGTRFITQGLHVHVGIYDSEIAINVNNAMRVYLPLLLALTTSSPFYKGVDTGLHSYRTKIFESLPLAGLPDYLDDWNHFVKLTNNLIDAKVIKSVKDLWWEVRPHPGFGTVEVRICDIPVTFKEILTLVALIQALVVTLQNLKKYPKVHIQILESNKWQAVRYGLDGIFIDPLTLQQLSIRKAIQNLCKLIEPSMISLGSAKYLSIVDEILTKGTGSSKKREFFMISESFEYVIRSLKEQFYV